MALPAPGRFVGKIISQHKTGVKQSLVANKKLQREEIVT